MAICPNGWSSFLNDGGTCCKPKADANTVVQHSSLGSRKAACIGIKNKKKIIKKTCTVKPVVFCCAETKILGSDTKKNKASGGSVLSELTGGTSLGSWQSCESHCVHLGKKLCLFLCSLAHSYSKCAAVSDIKKGN